MTLRAAALDFLAHWGHSPWLISVAAVSDGDCIRVATVYELPRALRQHLAQWQGWRVEFRAVGRMCED